MDVVAALDDEPNIRIMRLFNEPAGKQLLKDRGVDGGLVDSLDVLGISSIANIMGAIKMAKYFEWDSSHLIFTVATDSMEMYQSRLQEERDKHGEYSTTDAGIDYEGRLQAINTEALLELSYRDKKRMHNLKYFTWVEQQGKTVDELNAQWYDENYWLDRYQQVEQWDARIDEFNERTGLLKQYR